MPTTARCKAQEGAIAQNQSDIPAETTAIRVPTVDEIVNEQATYTKLCEEQSAVFRENVEEFKREFTLYRESGNVVKSGDSGNWQPAARDRDAFVAEMRRRCQQVPNSIADRVKIYFAAHAILACIVFVDMTRHPEEAQLEILRKSNKKCNDGLVRLPTTQTVNPLARSAANPRKRVLKVKDYKVFKRDPATLVDKQFLLKEDGSRSCLYKVTEVRFLKGSWQYLVQFEGCIDSVTIPREEVMEMLERSSLVEE